MISNCNEKIQLKDFIPILESITDAVFIDDSDGICRWCNNACEDLYNIKAHEMQGKHVEDLERDGIFTPSVAKRVLDEKREITIIHENRHGKRLLTTGTPLFDDKGNISKVITTSRDITTLTDSKQLEAGTGSVIALDDGDVEGFSSHDIISRSVTMKNVLALAKRLAAVNSTVLITGESGVGKSLIAKLLHEAGSRYDKPFITVNCGAIPENLIESELFGYVAGAFTGSRSDGKKGLFEAAQDGTIFLDEISELPLNLQVKLLRVIQEREITPIGAVTPIPIDVRIVSATNRNLTELVKQGKFREDLYYRLNVVPINMPPLRDRPEDILPLIQLNLKRCNNDLNENKTISPDALAVLLKYPWPGNIRELQNIVERLSITTSSNIITENSLPIFIKQEAERNANINVDLSLAAAMEKAEKEILKKTLVKYKSTRAIAKVLNVSQPTIVRKLHKYGLTSENI